jgi:hypothetical protein
MRGHVEGTGKTTGLSKDQKLTRYGDLNGHYMTDFGTPASKLALPPDNTGNMTNLIVKKPILISRGIIADSVGWGVGGGVQYYSNLSVNQLIALGVLSII